MERSDASKKHNNVSVVVEYFGEEDTEKTFEYIIDHFLTNGDLAPCNVIDMTENSLTSVSRDQSIFKMQDRADDDVLPLQRRHVTKPKECMKNKRVFDLTWGNTFNSGGDNLHYIPKCRVIKCNLDCNKITQSVIHHARSLYQYVTTREINQQRNRITVRARPIMNTLNDTQIW